jgi:hypothetical protein
MLDLTVRVWLGCMMYDVRVERLGGSGSQDGVIPVS